MLGQAKGANFPTKGDILQILLLDIIGSGRVGDAAAVQRGHYRESDAEGRVYLGDFLHSQNIAGICAGHTADFLAIGDAKHAGLTELTELLQGELAFFIPLQDAWKELLLGKLPRHLLDHLLLMRQSKIHKKHPFSLFH